MPPLHAVEILVLAGTAFAASGVAAVAGFGGAILLLPVLVWCFGVRDAVPILTIAQLVGNGSRVWFNRDRIHRRVVGWYSVGAVPLAMIGGALFAVAPAGWLARGIGLFLVAVVAWRRLGGGRYPQCPVQSFAAVGAGASLLSALVGSTGPVTAPFFLAFGLTRGAYIGTEAAATVITHLCKLAAYGSGSLLSGRVITSGLLLAPCMIAGSWFGKRVLDRLSDRWFVAMIEAVMVVAGLWLIASR